MTEIGKLQPQTLQNGSAPRPRQRTKPQIGHEGVNNEKWNEDWDKVIKHLKSLLLVFQTLTVCLNITQYFLLIFFFKLKAKTNFV